MPTSMPTYRGLTAVSRRSLDTAVKPRYVGTSGQSLAKPTKDCKEGRIVFLNQCHAKPTEQGVEPLHLMALLFFY